MTLHWNWLHAPRWLARARLNRATTLVLGVIGVSLVFSALRVLDVALAGASDTNRYHAVAMTPAAKFAPDRSIGDEPAGAGAPVDASLVDVPDATAQAISL